MKDELDIRIGSRVKINGTIYCAVGFENGEVVLKTPEEIQYEKDLKRSAPHIGDMMMKENEPHWVTEIKNGNVTLKSFKELYSKSPCGKCKYFFKNKGWIKRERVKLQDKMPVVMACSIGQFIITHDVWKLPAKCKLENFVNRGMAERKEYIKRVLNEFEVENAYAIIEPSVFGCYELIVSTGQLIAHNNILSEKDEMEIEGLK